MPGLCVLTNPGYISSRASMTTRGAEEHGEHNFLFEPGLAQ